MRQIILNTLFFLFISITLHSQTGSVFGKVTSEEGLLEWVNITIAETSLGVITDENGQFFIENVPFGNHEIQASFTGYSIENQLVTISKETPSVEVNFSLKESFVELNQVVVTGTKTFKRQTESAVIVNILTSKVLEDVQACNISEGLKFQPGLRVETDCQTCNYTQLRMNGLGGSYSQILINGRPVFSPLTGLYGLEQIPANMVERIEVVRGGGSALYGSSAIGGTVNVITKIPDENSYDLNFITQNINGGATDFLLNGNVNMLSKNKTAGVSIFVNRRQREAYDHNGDNFSELPELRNNSFGTNLFFQPTENQKLEVSLSSLNEFRYGGEMVEGAAHIAQQSEERTHHVLMGSADYQINFNGENSSFIAYLAGQRTDRDHFTGIRPDEATDIENYLLNPPYGTSENTTFQVGTQLNHRLRNFPLGSNVMTFGLEYLEDDVLDKIDAYNYKVDQLTQNFGTFLQSDWELTPSLNLLAGVRADQHNLVEGLVLSPRLSLLYRLKEMTQFRLTWGKGFRAPQAFDTDLHIAFAGGGISRIALSPELREERSNSFSGSINFDQPTEKYVFGFTAEGFFTQLKNAFYLHPTGEDNFGETFEKRNGSGATVQGGTLEIRGNYNRKMQLEAGITLQTSLFDEAVENIDELEPRREFLRTPNQYGYMTFTYMPNKNFNAAINMVHTGSMELAHFAGAPEQAVDAYVTSPSFTEWSFRLGYTWKIENVDSGLEFFGGIKNLTNAYQNDFDTGKDRDSNYVYGPAAPRTFFVGLRMRSF